MRERERPLISRTDEHTLHRFFASTNSTARRISSLDQMPHPPSTANYHLIFCFFFFLFFFTPEPTTAERVIVTVVRSVERGVSFFSWTLAQRHLCAVQGGKGFQLKMGALVHYIQVKAVGSKKDL